MSELMSKRDFHSSFRLFNILHINEIDSFPLIFIHIPVNRFHAFFVEFHLKIHIFNDEGDGGA